MYIRLVSVHARPTFHPCAYTPCALLYHNPGVPINLTRGKMRYYLPFAADWPNPIVDSELTNHRCPPSLNSADCRQTPTMVANINILQENLQRLEDLNAVMKHMAELERIPVSQACESYWPDTCPNSVY